MRLWSIPLLGLSLTSLALAQSTWTGNGSGNWPDSTDWSGSVPNGVNSVANFTSSASNTFVYVNSPETVGTVNIASGPYTYLFQGSSSLTLATSSGQAQLNNTAGNNIILSPVSLGNNSTISVATNTSLTLSDNFSSQGLTVTKTGSGTLSVPYIKSNTLDDNQGNVQILSSGSNSDVSVVHSLSLASGASLDLTNNSLIVDYATTDPLSTITGEVASAYDGGKWDLPGIKSSAASIAQGTTLAVGDSPSLGMLTYAGQPVSNAVIVKYTWYGDANMDGVVNASDLTFMQNEQAAGATGWMAGDFNYDGKINGDDYALFMLGEARQNGSLSGTTTAPEPSVLGLTALSLLAIRRKRKHKSLSRRLPATASSL